MRITTSTRSVLCFLLLVVAASCTDNQPQNSTVDGVIKPYPESLLTSALGIEPEATDRLIARDYLSACMLEAGFQVDAARLLETHVTPASYLFDIWATLTDIEFAEQYGFGVTASGSASLTELPVNPLDEFLAGLTEGEADAFHAALNDDDGCYNQAIRAEAESPANQDRSLYFQYRADIDGLIEKDPERIELVAEWSRCMFAKGYNYATMGDPRFEARERFALWVSSGVGTVEDLLAQEIRDAVASIECEIPIREGLIGVVNRVETTWLADNGFG